MNNTIIDNKKLETDIISARFKTRIGDIQECGRYIAELVDKGVYKIDFCPHCKSKNTYHKRILGINGKKGIHLDNVWRVENIEHINGTTFIKKDYCYDCQKEFMIEFYVWHYIGRITFKMKIKNKIMRVLS